MLQGLVYGSSIRRHAVTEICTLHLKGRPVCLRELLIVSTLIWPWNLCCASIILADFGIKIVSIFELFTFLGTQNILPSSVHFLNLQSGKLDDTFLGLQGLNQLQHAFHWATCYLHDEVVPVTIDICERLPFLKAVMADLTRTYLQQTEKQLLRDQQAAILKTAHKHAQASVASTSNSYHDQSSKAHHSRAA